MLGKGFGSVMVVQEDVGMVFGENYLSAMVL